MKRHYNHQEIEKRWSAEWQNSKIDEVDLAKAEDKFYALDMFPYPSGDGLHVGHWRGYVMSDFYARLNRLKGKTVLHPMGFDAFGLPAENAAIKHKSHPKKFTDTAIKNFTVQLKQMAASFDWSKTIVTSDPSYYRWTQWLFLQLYKHGLAEKRKSFVNWCPNDQTVLANEQVVNGSCERCGTKVEKKELSQWYFKTTALAEELHNGLEEVEWPEHVKTLQRNWIGKSEGAIVTFSAGETKIDVFTTRPDTLFGVTALVLAPEHLAAKELVTPERQDAFNEYCKEVASKTNVDRQQTKESEKTAYFTGAYATHPITKESLPIWVADYVLLEYGTGAVMSVPAHDERDFQFAKTHNLPIKQVISKESTDNGSGSDGGYRELFTGHGSLLDSGEFTGQKSEEAQAAIVKAAGGKMVTTYRLRDWLVSRQRYWGAPIPIVYDPEGHPHPVKDEHLPLILPTDVDFLPGGESPIARSQEYVDLAEKLYGKGWRFETDTLDTFVDSSWYYLRYLSPQDETQPFNAQLVKKWLPVDLYIGGIEHATLHLLYARFVARFLANNGYIDQIAAEPFKQLYNIGMVTLHGAKMSKSKGNVISPDPLIEHYGTDALRGYELFLGPMDIEVEWNPRGINGVHRFLIKVYELQNKLSDDSPTAELAQHWSRYLNAINDMIKNFRLNTYVSEAMKFINELNKLEQVPKSVVEDFVITLSPAFPYLAEEMYHLLGNKQSVFEASWPEAEVSNNEQASINILVNQRFVATLELGTMQDEQEIVQAACALETVQAKINGQEIKKTIYKPGQLVNIIV